MGFNINNDNSTIFDYFGPNPNELSIKKRKESKSKTRSKSKKSASRVRKSSVSSRSISKVDSVLDNSVRPVNDSRIFQNIDVGRNGM